jgi:hypothetical protein
VDFRSGLRAIQDRHQSSKASTSSMKVHDGYSMSSAEASEPKVVFVAKPSQQQRDRVMQQHGSRGHGDSRSLWFQRLGDRLVALVKVPFVSATEVTPVRLTRAGCGRVLNATVSAAGVCRIVAEKLSECFTSAGSQSLKTAEVAKTEADSGVEFNAEVCPTEALNPPHLRNTQGVEIFHCSQALRWDYSLQICTRSM